MAYESKPLTEKQNKLLEELLNNLQISNYSIHFSPGTKIGENFLGYITQAEVRGTVNNSKSGYHFVLKVAPNEKNFKLLAPVEEAYEREIYMYSKVFKEFTTFQNEKGNFIHFKSYPSFYKCIKECDEEMLILENMKASGFKHWPRGQHLDYCHVQLILKEYAKLHALSYALRDQKPELFEEMANNLIENNFDHFRRESLRQVGDHRFTNVLSCFNPVTDRLIYDKLKKFDDNKFSTLIRLMYSPNEYSVINHVDCGISNFLFKYKSSGTPTNACILDFQMSRLDSPAIDLCTLLFSAIDKSVRNRFHDLILEYYNSLCLFLKQLGSDPKKLLPFSTLQDELKQHGVVGLYWAIHIIYVQTTISKDLSNVFEDDSNTDQLSLVYDLDDKTLFNTTVRDSILDFDKLGYDFY